MNGKGKMLGINEKFGHQPILVVKRFNFLPQYNERPPSTWFYGLQCMYQYDDPTNFITYLEQFRGVPAPWCQIGLDDDESIQEVESRFPKMPTRLVATETLTLVAGGKDPIRGYFLQFAGSVNNLFTHPDWWKDALEINF